MVNYEELKYEDLAKLTKEELRNLPIDIYYKLCQEDPDHFVTHEVVIE